jgi:hypothetical protein
LPVTDGAGFENRPAAAGPGDGQSGGPGDVSATNGTGPGGTAAGARSAAVSATSAQQGERPLPPPGPQDPDDPLSVVTEWGNLAPMIGFLAVAGALLSLATANDWAWAFVIGFVMVVLWLASLLAGGHLSRWSPW